MHPPSDLTLPFIYHSIPFFIFTKLIFFICSHNIILTQFPKCSFFFLKTNIALSHLRSPVALGLSLRFSVHVRQSSHCRQKCNCFLLCIFFASMYHLFVWSSTPFFCQKQERVKLGKTQFSNLGSRQGILRLRTEAWEECGLEAGWSLRRTSYSDSR